MSRKLLVGIAESPYKVVNKRFSLTTLVLSLSKKYCSLNPWTGSAEHIEHNVLRRQKGALISRLLMDWMKLAVLRRWRWWKRPSLAFTYRSRPIQMQTRCPTSAIDAPAPRPPTPAQIMITPSSQTHVEDVEISQGPVSKVLGRRPRLVAKTIAKGVKYWGDGVTHLRDSPGKRFRAERCYEYCISWT